MGDLDETLRQWAEVKELDPLPSERLVGLERRLTGTVVSKGLPKTIRNQNDREAYWRRCPAQAICKQAHQLCGPKCIGFIQLDVLYGMSEMPDRYRIPQALTPDPADEVVWKELMWIEERIQAFVDHGEGVYIWSHIRGNGKTSWGCRLLNAYALKVALKNQARCRILMINVPQFLQQLRNSIEDKNTDVYTIRQRIEVADVVLWDDIGAEKPSQWVQDQLYGWINYREMHGLSNLYTSNVSLGELGSTYMLGARIGSRIQGQALVCEFKGPDRRKDLR